MLQKSLLKSFKTTQDNLARGNLDILVIFIAAKKHKRRKIADTCVALTERGYKL